MRPGYGLRSADADPVWGARWIWPDDVVWDRTDLKASTQGRAADLTVWLNAGPLMAAREEARRLAQLYHLRVSEDRDVTLYEDDRGVIVGNPQASHGYLYVAAWLK